MGFESKHFYFLFVVAMESIFLKQNSVLAAAVLSFPLTISTSPLSVEEQSSTHESFCLLAPVFKETVRDTKLGKCLPRLIFAAPETNVVQQSSLKLDYKEWIDRASD